MPADVQIKGRVGDVEVTEGQSSEFRQGRMGDLITNLMGKYGELARRGRLFHGVTATAGVAPGTTITTLAPAALANPFGSDVDLEILVGFMIYVSGTLGTGGQEWVAHKKNLILPTGTAVVSVPGRIDGPDSIGRMLETATVLTGGQVFRPFCYLAPMLASSVLAPQVVRDDVDGAIVVPPGCSVSIQGVSAAGTSPLVRFGIMWAEVPR